ncbi:MAG: hypothetical protein KatS3mg105_5222 [Gemmatales bacterium]|nr:MAG: hypothetical protein KatS3mg105_5222 [Gemmatales bacterium]
MKLLTFLGINNYSATRYKWGDESSIMDTRLFPVALVEWLQPDEVLVFLTKQAQEHQNWKELSDKIDATPVPIASGASESELWQIFDAIVDRVDEADDLVIDITHGFRSLPLLGLLVAAYLRHVKQARVMHLVYGAFEARDRETNVSPVFELTPFVGLFDWIVAADHFQRTGFGVPLAELMRNATGKVAALRDNILELSDCLQLLRPLDVIESSSRLRDTIKSAATEIAADVPPLEEMLDHVAKSYGAFSADSQNPVEVLEAQLRMVEWCAQQQQFVQALALAREWLPSVLCIYFGVDPQNLRERADMELLLTGGKVKDPKTGKTVKESPRRGQWSGVPARKKLRRLWNDPPYTLANLRNDLLHAGFRKNPRDAQEIKTMVPGVLEELRTVWAEIRPKLESTDRQTCHGAP